MKMDYAGLLSHTPLHKCLLKASCLDVDNCMHTVIITSMVDGNHIACVDQQHYYKLEA